MSTDFTRREALLAGAGGLLAVSPKSKRKPVSDHAAPAPDPAAPREVAPATSQPEAPFTRLDRRILELLTLSGTPGMSIAIIQRNTIVYTKAYGLANVAAQKPMTPETVFQAASLTKPVFTYAALKLCERGLMGLDTPLFAYIDHTRISRDARANRITPRMVLAHMSGLPNFASGTRPMKIDFDPGAHFGYSGEAFNVLQEVVEKQSGLPLNALLTESVSAPFGLVQSQFVWTDELESSVAIGYEWDGTPVKSASKPTDAIAASSLHTTAHDYATFMIRSIAHEQHAAQQLEYSSERMMLSPQVCLGGPLAWGLGWALLLKDDGDMHWHLGDSRGYMSYAAMSRKTGDGVVIFTNCRHGLRACHAVARELLPDQDTIFSWIYEVFYEGKLPQWRTA